MAAKITVREDSGILQVTVREGGSETSHRVTVPDDYYRRLTAGKISKADCVRASFRFLLEREPKESILGKFELPVIATYFPEFESEFERYVE